MPLCFLQWRILALNQHQWFQRWSCVYICAPAHVTHQQNMTDLPRLTSRHTRDKKNG